MKKGSVLLIFFLCLLSYASFARDKSKGKTDDVPESLIDSPIIRVKKLKKVIKEKKVEFISRSKDISIRLIGCYPVQYPRYQEFSPYISKKIDKMFNMFLTYSKVPEFRIDAIYGNFATAADIEKNIKGIRNTGVAVFYLLADLTNISNRMYLLCHDTRAMQSGTMVPLDHFLSEEYETVFLIDPLTPGDSSYFITNNIGSNAYDRPYSFIYLKKDVFGTDSLLADELVRFYTNHTGADISIKKDNSTFYDLFGYFQGRSLEGMVTNLSNTVFIPWKWSGKDAVTNFKTEYVYEYRTNEAKEGIATRNFISYDILQKQEIIKEKVGVEIEYEIVYKDGNWE